jgi:hypothetical protein
MHKVDSCPGGADILVLVGQTFLSAADILVRIDCAGVMPFPLLPHFVPWVAGEARAVSICG